MVDLCTLTRRLANLLLVTNQDSAAFISTNSYYTLLENLERSIDIDSNSSLVELHRVSTLGTT